MSSGNFRNLVKEKLLQNVSAQSEKTMGELSRRLMESAQVKQLFVMNRRTVLQLQAGFVAGVESGNMPIDNKLLTKYRKELRVMLRQNARPVPQELKEGLMGDIAKARRLRFDSTLIYFPVSFETIKDRIAAFHVDFAQKNLGVKFNENKEFGKTTQFDHGADGPAQGSFTAATFGVRAALDSGIDEKKLFKTVEENLQAVYAKELGGLAGQAVARRLYSLMGSFSQAVTIDGKVDAGAALIITALDASENAKRGSIEKREMDNLLNALEKAVQQHLGPQEYLDFVGSSTLKAKMSKVAIDKFVNNLVAHKNLKIKKKISPKLKATKLSSSANSPAEKTRQVKGKGRRPNVAKGRMASAAAAGAGAAGKGGRKERAKHSKVSLTSFLAILNAQMQKTVAKNMGSPRLNNQTGTFLSSIRAVDINTTARGFPSVGYTYEKRPYQVFESTSGSRFASSERDPRRLIEQSIREIAAQNQIGRLFARRV